MNVSSEDLDSKGNVIASFFKFVEMKHKKVYIKHK